jgi:hypothetical protein
MMQRLQDSPPQILRANLFAPLRRGGSLNRLTYYTDKMTFGQPAIFNPSVFYLRLEYNLPAMTKRHRHLVNLHRTYSARFVVARDIPQVVVYPW